MLVRLLRRARRLLRPILLPRRRGRVVVAPEVLRAPGPVVFLAGPIQGARDWQADATMIISSLAPRVHVANPRRPVFLDGDYDGQVDWETRHLRRAGEDGVVLFWLARESAHLCERAFAQTTRFELGEWKMRHERDGATLVVGIEEGFTNARYVRRRLAQDCPGVPVLRSLEDACRRAAELA